MNNGANIVWIGSAELIREAGDSKITNQYNRTELSRRYSVRKTVKDMALALLRTGYRAPEYANLYLLNAPRENQSATFTAFDCTFSGILDQTEGGNGADYERVEKPQNVAAISTTIVYLQPIYRFLYTIPVDAEARVFTRVITRPDQIKARDNTTGDVVFYDGGDFFWEPYDLQRNNFDKYDEVIESWRLTYRG